MDERWEIVSEMIDTFLYIFFYVFPFLMLFFGSKFSLNFDIFPIPLKMVDLITPYLLLSITIQTLLAGAEPLHLYFYIFLSFFGIVYASYLAFGKRMLLVGNFFRTWWRYAFIFSLSYHVIIGGYGIFINFF